MLGMIMALPTDSQANSVVITYDANGNQISQQTAAASAPIILNASFSQVVAPGDASSFSVVVASSLPVTYQWYLNNVAIAGATSDTLLFPNVTAANDGSYTVTVTNTVGSATSSIYNLGLDASGNGLPDAWELAHFGNLNQTAAGDFDNDGVTNAEEFADGTDPTLDTSYKMRLTLVCPGGNIGAAPRSDRYPLGQVVSLSATPMVPNSFYGWGGDAFSLDEATTVTMDGHKTVYADFSTTDVRVWGDTTSNPLAPPAGLTGVKALAPGSRHCLALKKDGTVVGWGDNSSGQCDVPAGLVNIVAIAANGNASMALKSDGTVAVWGDLGFGITVPADLNNVVAVSATTALKADGTVVQWSGDPRYPPPAGLSTVTAIASGFGFTLALKADGTVVTWGDDVYSGVLTIPPGLSHVVAIAGVSNFALALKSDGTVVTWGTNYSGPLAPPAGLNGVTAISANSSNSMALKADGTVVNWGGNIYGQSTPPAGLPKSIFVAEGISTSFAIAARDPSTPAPVLSVSAPVVAASHVAFSYKLPVKNSATSYAATGLPAGLALGAESGLVTGTALTSGTYVVTVSLTNAAGSTTDTFQLTVIPTEPSIAPAELLNAYAGNSFSYQVSAINAPSSFAAAGLPPGLTIDSTTGLISGTPSRSGLYQVSLSATNEFGTGTQILSVHVLNVAAWGYNNSGQTMVPDGLDDVVALAAGESHSLALKSDGTVAAWGDNTYGQANVPAGLSGVVSITAGRNHSLALKSDGTVVGWGINEYSQIDVPVGLTNVAAIAAGEYYSLALKHDGTVVIWGDAGDGIPDIPAGVSDVVAIASGYYHILVLKADGSVISWGYNEYGQTTVPPDLSGVVAIGAGAQFSLAIKADGTTVGWGNNTDGECLPQSSTAGFSELTGGFWHSVGVEKDGTLREWGYGGDNHDAMVDGVTHGVSIVAGSRHTMALLAARPRITSILRQNVLPNASWSYRIRGSNTPTSFAVSGLPSGMNLNTSTGIISGIVPASGTFHLNISAQNLYGSSSSTLVLAVIPSLAEALDAPTLTWSTGGNLPWKGQFDVTSDEVDAAQSGPITDSGISWIETSIAGPGTLTFSWRVSSEMNWDFLRFSIDGTEQKKISGTTVSWQNETFAIPSGQHAVRWSYTKDDSFSSGLDTGWLDQVVFSTVGSGIAAWKETYWPGNSTSAQAADLADPDNDGLKNRLEYALGMNPTVSSNVGMPTLTTNGSGFIFSFNRPRSDITYIVEESLDLVNWSTVATNPGSIGTIVAVPILQGGWGRKFVRLRVELSQP